MIGTHAAGGLLQRLARRRIELGKRGVDVAARNLEIRRAGYKSWMTSLELPAGTQPGQIVVLRGRGMPVLQGFGRGDQRVLVNVLVPRHLDDEQRRLLREFDERAGDQTYAKGDGSLFDKLKSAFR